MSNIKLSVIIPIYNVAEFLKECLDSVVNQSLTDIEVLMIDDGSTDDSSSIAKLYERNYPHFHYYYKENGGLGSARNYAIPFVKGEYLVFLDSDDIIPQFAYEKMYNLAKKTGNDIVCGNVKRFDSKGEFDSSLHKKVLVKDIEKTHISSYKELVYDTTSTNKMFKTEFYKKHDFQFPVGMYYEDIPIIIPALWKANGVSIITDTCYLWRTREGENKSITQKRTVIKNFTDRIKALDIVNAFYQDNVTDKECIALKDYKYLDTDLKLFIKEMNRTSNEYNEIAFKEINRFLDQIDSQVFDSLRLIDKIKYYFIKNRDIESLKKVLDFQSKKSKYRIKKTNNQYVVVFPFDVPQSLADITDEFRHYPLKYKILNVNVINDFLSIDLFMRLPKLENQYDFKTEAFLVCDNENDGQKIEMKRSFLKKNVYARYTRGKKKLIKAILKGYFYTIKVDLNQPRVLELLNKGCKVKVIYKNDILSKEFILADRSFESHINELNIVSDYENVFILNKDKYI